MTTTFSDVTLTIHVPPLKPTTTSNNKPTEPSKPTEHPKDNPYIDPKITLSSMLVNEYLTYMYYHNINHIFVTTAK